VRAPSAADRLGLLTEGAVAVEAVRALAPAVLADSLEAILALGIAEIVGELKTWAACAHHLTHISVASLEPAGLRAHTKDWLRSLVVNGFRFGLAGHLRNRKLRHLWWLCLWL